MSRLVTTPPEYVCLVDPNDPNSSEKANEFFQRYAPFASISLGSYGNAHFLDKQNPETFLHMLPVDHLQAVLTDSSGDPRGCKYTTLTTADCMVSDERSCFKVRSASEDDARVIQIVTTGNVDDNGKPVPCAEAGMRLHNLFANTPGGCNPNMNAFRRLLLASDQKFIEHIIPPDGGFTFRLHLTDMKAIDAPLHYHREDTSTEGNRHSQVEFYYKFDDGDTVAGLQDHPSYALLAPNVDKIDEYVFFELRQGQLLLIPPPVVHRGINLPAAVGAFKRFGVEMYCDKEMKAVNGPFNPNWVTNQYAEVQTDQITDFSEWFK